LILREADAKKETKQFQLDDDGGGGDDDNDNDNKVWLMWYNRVKKDQLDAQLILSIFRQSLHVSAVFRPIIRRYNRMYTTARSTKHRI
jgi:hypothetical protein